MNYTEGLFRFIEKSPTPFHVIDNMKQELAEQGYKQLLEREEWKLEQGGKYYVIRNGSAMVAFRVPKGTFGGFQIVASHSDAPCLKPVSYTHLDVYKRQLSQRDHMECV